MCGRFTRKENFQHLAKLLGIHMLPPLEPRYNIAPSQLVACVRTNLETRDREYVPLKWGLVPAWAKDPRMGNTMINARAETVAEKPAFRKALRHQRCVVLADGFYEWKREGKTKQPYYIHLTDNRPFVFAGLWECWAKEGEQPLESCAMVTTGPNALMESIHQRMPVILSPKNYDLWLDLGVQNPQSLLPILQPYPPEEMEAFPTSLIVNNPRNDSPLCVQPLG